MHSPIPINEAEARRSLHAGIDKAVTRSHIKACAPLLPRVSPVLVLPEHQRSKELRRFVEANRESIDAEWASYPDGRGGDGEQARFAEANRERIDAEWESL